MPEALSVFVTNPALAAIPDRRKRLPWHLVSRGSSNGVMERVDACASPVYRAWRCTRKAITPSPQYNAKHEATQSTALDCFAFVMALAAASLKLFS